MDAPPPQRVDIAQIVGEYQGKSPRQARESLENAEAAIGPPLRRAREARAGPWYLVIDELLEGRATLEAWPWPTVNPTTGYLSFDLSQTARFTREAVDVHRVVSEHRSAEQDEPAASRPLRIGDVFEVAATDVTNLSTWTSVDDHTREKRAEVRAAFDAMAAPPNPPDMAAKLERLAREQAPPEPVAESALTPAATAHAAL